MQSKRPPFDATFKLNIIGDSSVGKTCIFLRFVDEKFSESYLSTIGVDFKQKSIDVDDNKVQLQIWDTAGCERFRTITQNFYRGSHGIVLVYDVTEEDSFKNIRKWISQIEPYTEKDVVKVIVGNKADITSDRVISNQMGEDLAAEFADLEAGWPQDLPQGVIHVELL